MKKSILALTLVASFAATAATAPAGPMAAYVDNTLDGYLSGAKGAITNVQPERILYSGSIFEPADEPRPFAVSENKEELPRAIVSQLLNSQTDGLMVINKGEIVADYYRLGFQEGDWHLIMSVGKALTSIALEDVYNAGHADRKMSDIIPSLAQYNIGSATLQQAMNMTVGSEWSENFNDPNSHTMQSDFVSGWQAPKGEPKSWETLFDSAKVGEHGETWVYNSATIVAASWAGAAIEGRPYKDIIIDTYNKLGFEDFSWYVHNDLGEYSSEGGQALTLRDMAKMGRYMLENQDSQYVIDTFSAEHSAKGSTFPVGVVGTIDYTNYWYNISADEITAIGSCGMFVYVNKATDVIVAKQSSMTVCQDYDNAEQQLKLIREIAELYK